MPDAIPSTILIFFTQFEVRGTGTTRVTGLRATVEHSLQCFQILGMDVVADMIDTFGVE